jgi:hypothetical protein
MSHLIEWHFHDRHENVQLYQLSSSSERLSYVYSRLLPDVVRAVSGALFPFPSIEYARQTRI